jgi:murein DD-endopeptidase MepM/ murein hydrolase activator NlpD
MARGFLQSDCYKKLTDKGYICSVKLTPLPPPEVHIKTKSTSALCTQGIIIGGATIYFEYDPADPTEYYTRMYACEYSFSISMQQLESQYIQYFIGYGSGFCFTYQFEYTRGEYIQLLDPSEVFAFWDETLNYNAWANVAGILYVYSGDPNPIHGCDSHEEYYYLGLTANPLAGGSVIGEGSYPGGSPVMIAAYHNSGFKFVNWTGSDTISAYSTTVYVDSSMYFIANFRPCFDTDKANPLGHMELAPPNPNNIQGATFGRYVRDNGTNPHWGIDLEGAVGTPIYAQFDGTIAKPPVTEQPNRINEEYPSNYSGDTDNGGNRIFVDSNVGGNTVRNGYMHLQAGNPVATNPRTGQPFKEGNPIYAGEVIGYIGHTGNASASRPHLHLKTTVNGALANPADYFNATVSTTVTTITTPCD